MHDNSIPPFGALVTLARKYRYTGPTRITETAAEAFKGAALDYQDTDEKGEPGKQRRNLFSTREQDKHLPPQQWLVEDLIAEDTDVAVIAPSKFLKTFVSIEIACAIERRTRCFGKLAALRQSAVFFCAAEGGRSLKQDRITAWEIAHGLEPYSTTRVHVATAVPLLGTNDLADFISDARAHLEPGERAGLFITDTMNRALNGADEDKSSTASIYFNQLATIRRELGCSTLTVHHMGKNLEKGLRGSSAFYAGFDTVIVIDKAVKDEKTGCYVLTVRVDKQKDGEDGQEFHLRSRKIDTPRGSSLVLEPISEDEAKRAAGKQIGLRRSEVGAALHRFGACPGGINEWNGRTGGTTTRNLAILIAQARAAAEGNPRKVMAKGVNVLVTTLNRGARSGGPFEAYVVNASGARQWAIAEGVIQDEEIIHA